MRSAATEEIDSGLAAAREERERGHAEGLAKGLKDAADQWTETALLEAASTRRSLIRQSHRLSQIVSLAIEPIIEQEDRVTMFNRTLKAVCKLVKDVSMATLHVSPSELGSALSAVAGFTPCATGRLQIEVKGDAALPPGSCRFESDQGIIDAGLKTQLAAIQRAVSRAAQHMLLEPTSGQETSAEAAVTEPDASRSSDGPQPARTRNDEQDDALVNR